MNTDIKHYTIIIQWDERDDIYVVSVPELPGCMTHGKTYEEALQQAQDAIESWVQVAKELGRPIPPPNALPLDIFGDDVYTALKRGGGS